MPNDTDKQPYDILIERLDAQDNTIKALNEEIQKLKKTNEEMANFNRSLLNKREVNKSDNLNDAKAKLEKYLNE